MTKSEVVATKVGKLLITACEDGLEAIEFADAHTKAKIALNKAAPTKPTKKADAHIKKAKLQLAEYFEGKRQYFDLDLAPKRGTQFQKKVWKTLCGIPFGKTWSYTDVATKIGSPKAVRAVGGANNRNPIAIVVPCHRVIGKNGALVGYGGGLDLKTKLLKLEGALKNK